MGSENWLKWSVFGCNFISFALSAVWFAQMVMGFMGLAILSMLLFGYHNSEQAEALKAKASGVSREPRSSIFQGKVLGLITMGTIALWIFFGPGFGLAAIANIGGGSSDYGGCPRWDSC